MGVTKIIGSVEGRIPPLVLSPNERAMMRRDVEYKLRGVSRGLLSLNLAMYIYLIRK